MQVYIVKNYVVKLFLDYKRISLEKREKSSWSRITVKVFSNMALFLKHGLDLL
jgi:hypothetical protein